MCLEFAVEYGFVPSPDRILSVIDSLAAGEDSALLVTNTLDGVIGLVAKVHPFGEDVMAQEIVWWVDPAARKNGTGTKLLRAAEDWARDRGAKTMLMVAPNDAVGLYYNSIGYKPFETFWKRSL